MGIRSSQPQTVGSPRHAVAYAFVDVAEEPTEAAEPPRADQQLKPACSLTVTEDTATFEQPQAPASSSAKRRRRRQRVRTPHTSCTSTMAFGGAHHEATEEEEEEEEEVPPVLLQQSEPRPEHEIVDTPVRKFSVLDEDDETPPSTDGDRTSTGRADPLDTACSKKPAQGGSEDDDVDDDDDDGSGEDQLIRRRRRRISGASQDQRLTGASHQQVPSSSPELATRPQGDEPCCNAEAKGEVRWSPPYRSYTVPVRASGEDRIAVDAARSVGSSPTNSASPGASSKSSSPRKGLKNLRHASSSHWRRDSGDVVAAMYPTSADRLEPMAPSSSGTAHALYPTMRWSAKGRACPTHSPAEPNVIACLVHLSRHMCHWIREGDDAEPSDDAVSEAFDVYRFSSESPVMEATPTSIARTMEWLFKVLQIEPQCCVIAAIYVQRILARGVRVTRHNFEPLLVAALLVSTKVWDDMSTVNDDFAKALPHYELQDINRLEHLFLSTLGWNCHVTGRDYTTFYFGLASGGPAGVNLEACDCHLQTLSRPGVWVEQGRRFAGLQHCPSAEWDDDQDDHLGATNGPRGGESGEFSSAAATEAASDAVVVAAAASDGAEPNDNEDLPVRHYDLNLRLLTLPCAVGSPSRSSTYANDADDDCVSISTAMCSARSLSPREPRTSSPREAVVAGVNADDCSVAVADDDRGTHLRSGSVSIIEL
jgi:hypothetical protein